MLRRVLFLLALAMAALNVGAAPVCVDAEGMRINGAGRGGIGGTGMPAAGGIGGTGAKISSGGIGGTGQRLAGSIGGIGGTGAPAAPGERVGLVGVITGFASVCVSGVEVHYDSQMPVSSNGIIDPATPAPLAVGQLVSIEALMGAGGLHAHRISIINALEGPITALPSNGHSIVVMGRVVAIDAATRLAAGGSFSIGQMVKVAALTRADGSILATRVDPAPGLSSASVAGYVPANGGSVGGVAAHGATGNAGQQLVRGTWNGTHIDVHSSMPDPSHQFSGPLDRLYIEGLVQHVDASGAIRVAGVNAHLSSLTHHLGGASPEIRPNQRIWLDLTRSHAGGWQVRQFEVLHAPESPRSATSVVRPAAADPVRSERTETVERPDSLPRTERQELPERLERLERPERVERPEKVERPERVERPEKVERPERVERPEKVERPEVPERTERR